MDFKKNMSHDGTSSVADLARRLRESLDRADTDIEPATPPELASSTAVGEGAEDELALRLRAQLEKKASAPTVMEAREAIEVPGQIEELEADKNEDVIFLTEISFLSASPPVAVAESDNTADKYRPITDDHINGQPLSGLLEGAFMAQLAEETRARLLEESSPSDTVVSVSEVISVSEGVESPHESDISAVCHTSDPERQGGTRQDVMQGYDPLQVGLDTVRAWTYDLSLPNSGFDILDEEDGTQATNIRITEGAADDGVNPMKGSVDLLLGEVGEDDLLSPRSTEDLHEAYPAEVSSKKAKAYTVLDDKTRRDDATEMYLRMGYEDELRCVEPASRIHRVKKNHIFKAAVGTRNATPAVSETEFPSDAVSTHKIDLAYRKAVRRACLRLWVTVAAALLMLGYDLLPHIGTSILLPESVMAFLCTSLYPAVGVMGLLLACLPHARRLVRGLRSILDFEPICYAVPALGMLMATLYGVMCCFLMSGGTMPLFGGVALLLLSLVCVTDWWAIRAEHLAFHTVSSGKGCFVAIEEDGATVDATAAEIPDCSSRYGVGRDEPLRLRTAKTERLEDYFYRVNRYNEQMGILNYLLPIGLLASLLCAGVTVLFGGDPLRDGVRMFVIAYLTALPCGFLLAVSLPWFRANRLIGARGCTVVGGAAANEYVPDANVSRASAHLTVRDGDALKATQIKAVTLKGDSEASDYRLMARKLFALLGCAMSAEEEPVPAAELEGIRVEIVTSRPHFLHLYMVDSLREEAVEVMMGTHDALGRHGIRLPRANMEQVYKKTENSHVVYLAFDGQFRVAYAVEYRRRNAMIQTAKILGQMGFSLSMVTYDPLVNRDHATFPADMGMPPLTVVRPGQLEDLHGEISSGVVATGQAMDLVYPLLACRQIKKVYGRGALLSYLFMILSVGGMLTMAVMRSTSCLNSLLLCLWHLFWTGTVTLVACLTVRKRTLALSDMNDGRINEKRKQLFKRMTKEQ